MITTETFFWFYSTLAQVAAAIIVLICVFFITYYSIIKSKRLDERREEKFQTDELSRIRYLRWELGSLFKDCPEFFLSKPSTDVDQANNRFAAARTKEEVLEAFKEICMSFPLSFERPLSDDDLDNHMRRLISFSNVIIVPYIITYLKEENPKLSDEKIAEIKSKARRYEGIINKIKDIRKEIDLNNFESHFPNKNKIIGLIIVTFFVGVVFPLVALLTLEWFSIRFSIPLLLIFLFSLCVMIALIIKDITSEREGVVID